MKSYMQNHEKSCCSFRLTVKTVVSNILYSRSSEIKEFLVYYRLEYTLRICFDS